MKKSQPLAHSTPIDISLDHSAEKQCSASIKKFSDLPDCAYVRLPEVMALFACSRATVWRWVRDHRIPAPKKLGARISAWQVGELKATLELIRERGGFN